MNDRQCDLDHLRSLLDRLERHWREVGAPVLRLLQPGLSGDEIDEATESVGLRLPVEARVMYGWHNGARLPQRHEGTAYDPSIGALGARLLPLDQAVDVCRRRRRLDAEAVDEEPDLYDRGDHWAPSWFPLTEDMGGDSLAVDCAVPEGSATPVRMWDTDSFGEEVAADSLTEVVATWVLLLDRGLIHWDGDKRRWEQDVHRIEPWMHRRAGHYAAT